MADRNLNVGQSISPEARDEQLARIVPKACRECFPNKDFCPDGVFYLQDGNARRFVKAGFVDD